MRHHAVSTCLIRQIVPGRGHFKSSDATRGAIHPQAYNICKLRAGIRVRIRRLRNRRDQQLASVSPMEPMPIQSPMQSDSLILAHTTCGSAEEAEQLAARLVEEHLVACAAIGPSQLSIYPWQGKIEREREVPLTLKTTAARFEALENRLGELHSYDVPELLATQVVESGHEYERWVRDWVTRQDN